MMSRNYVIVLAIVVLFLVGACSQKRSRVDASRPGGPSAVERSATEDEEARRRADERRSEELQAKSEETRGAAERKVMDEIRAFESEPVYFEFDRSDISPEYRPMLEKKAAWLKARPEYRIRVEGHCDERGTAEYNVALGEKRAFNVTEYLVVLGVPAKRIVTISYGEERPAYRGQDETAWARNRRAEFRLLK
jgi:peptidoglycan-associated lipoprotein